MVEGSPYSRLAAVNDRPLSPEEKKKEDEKFQQTLAQRQHESPEQRKAAEASRENYEQALHDNRYGDITTEIKGAGEFFYAEPYHQQYLAKNPNGYCGLGGTGVSCPIGLATS